MMWDNDTGPNYLDLIPKAIHFTLLTEEGFHVLTTFPTPSCSVDKGAAGKYRIKSVIHVIEVFKYLYVCCIVKNDVIC